MTHYKMPKQPIDDKPSLNWGLAALKSVGAGLGAAGGNVRLFDLINMDTYRAHRMTITDLSAGIGLPISVSLMSSDYTYFQTSRPANFPDFDKKSASVNTIDLALYAWTTVMIFDGQFKGVIRGGKRLAEVKSEGFGLATPELTDSWGLTEIYYSDGRPVKTPEYKVKVNVPTDEGIPDGVDVAKYDYGYVVRIRGDVLFDPDKDLIHYKSDEVLSGVIKYINSNQDFKRIVIEGHTDIKMDHVPGYNMDLSRRRAQAVLNYFKKNEWAFDAKHPMETRWFGAKKPVELNNLPNGGDNPGGRQKNRRVEIYLYKK